MFKRARTIKSPPRRQRAFTLVELVVGIVLTGIALSLLSTVFFSASSQSAEPLLQIRAAELGQAMMDEVLSRPFDEHTPLGGVPACEGTTPTCSVIGDLGSDGEVRAQFDDVDDYHDYCSLTPPLPIVDVFGNSPGQFNNFRMSICVSYDGDYDGTVNEAGAVEFNAKLIEITIFPPAAGGLGQPISFAAYRGNF